jgi:DnaJ-domain-containing protein 1
MCVMDRRHADMPLHRCRCGHSVITDNHPDKLIARGVPKEFIAIATKKTAAINEAYDVIAKERRI